MKSIGRSIWRPAIRLFSILAVSFVISSVPPVHAEDRPLAMAGSGSNLPLIRLLVTEFAKKNPGVRVEEPANIGSLGAAMAVADGAVTLGLMSRDLTEKEKGLGISLMAYARTGLVNAVNLSVPDDDMTYADLVNIYRGKRTKWRNGRTIVVLTRESTDSTIEVLETTVPDFREAYAESMKAGRWSVQLKDEVMNRSIVNTEDSLGFSDTGAIAVNRLPVKALRLNGIAPTHENIASGRYPLCKTLYFAYREDLVTPEGRRFMAFARSATVRSIMSANGYVPVE